MPAILRPDMGKVVWLVAGVLIATYTGVTRFLPRR